MKKIVLMPLMLIFLFSYSSLINEIEKINLVQKTKSMNLDKL